MKSADFHRRRGDAGRRGTAGAVRHRGVLPYRRRSRPARPGAGVAGPTGQRIGHRARGGDDRPQGARCRRHDQQTSGVDSDAGDRAHEERRVPGSGRARPLWALSPCRSDQPRRSGNPAGPLARPDRRQGVADRAQARRAGRPSRDFRLSLVLADDLALSPTACRRADRLFLRADFRARDAAVFSGRRRQSARPQRLFDAFRSRGRHGRDRIVRRRAAIFAHLRPFAHDESHRRGTRSATLRASAASAAQLFRDAVGRADGRAGARTGDDPEFSHRTGAILDDRSCFYVRVRRRAARLFLEADDDRVGERAHLSRHRLRGAPAAAGTHQGEVQPRRGEPAVSRRGDRRHSHHQGRRGRTDHARAMGGTARRLRADELFARRCSARAARTQCNT